MEIHLTPIGKVASTRTQLGDDAWDRETARIVLDADAFGDEALLGLGDFSHVAVLFYLDQVPSETIETAARRPRDNPAWPRVGIFAQRGKNRPNRLGLTVCKIEKVEGRTLWLQGLDAIDGTPVLDLKPWIEEFGPRGEVHQPAWASELMQRYWK